MSGATTHAPLAARARAAALEFAALAGLVAAGIGVKLVSQTLVPASPPDLPGAFGETFRGTPAEVGRITTAFGFLLVAAWLAGRLAHALGLPRISGYLVIGVLCGPHFAHLAGVPPLISQFELDRLGLIEGLAVAMIGFVAGSEIKLPFVMAQLGTIVRVVHSEFVGVFLGVMAVMVVLLLAAPMPAPLQGASAATQLYLAGMVAVLAVASSPAATIALIRELRPNPDFARLAMAITVVKDVALVVMFSALLSAGIAAIGPGAASTDTTGEPSLLWLPVTIGMRLVGSLLFGGAVAVVMWALGRFIAMRIELFLMLVCYGIAVVSAELSADPLLAALTAGIILTNIGSNRAMPRLLASMDGMLLPVYCVFFAVAGAKLHLDAMGVMWPAMAIVVAVRIVAKRIAVTRAARRAGVPEPAATWLWTTTLPQAGVTLAMAIQFERSFAGHEWAPMVAALLLAVVACNELIGPPLMKLGIQRTMRPNPTAMDKRLAEVSQP